MDNSSVTIISDPELNNPQFPLTHEGKTMHLNVGPGDVANRILSVGDYKRAELLKGLLDSDYEVKEIKSYRGFVTYTGRYKGTPVSIIATGMGTPMMDFVVRESTHFLKGKIAMIRLGTCGGLKSEYPAGSISVAKHARFLSHNYDWIPDQETHEAYKLSRRHSACEITANLLVTKLKESFQNTLVVEGTNITCEGFYSTQGRDDPHINDYNTGLIDKVIESETEAISMEMETFKLLHLAACSKGRISAAACAIMLMNRITGQVLEYTRLRESEILAGTAVLNCLAELQLDKEDQ